MVRMGALMVRASHMAYGMLPYLSDSLSNF
jgi:hypothetical protein